MRQMMEMATKHSIIEHFKQKHGLKALSRETLEGDHCIVCRQDKEDILGWLYYCCTSGCSLHYFHKSCSEIPPVLLYKQQQQKHSNHDHHHNHFHPQHPLFLAYSIEIPSQTCCNACGRDFYFDPLVYICLELECSFILHVTCSFLTPTTTTTTTTKTIEPQDHPYQPNHHPHPLILCDPPNIYNYKCTCCCLPFDTRSPTVYVCLDCNALLHKSCSELPFKLDHHLFHPLHPLLLRPVSRGHFVCWACHSASLQPTTSISTSATENNEEDDPDHQFTHSNPLILCHNKYEFPIPCHVCELPLGDYVYLCPTCHVSIHTSCAQMPREIKHPFHPPHPLTLVVNDRNCGPCEGCFSNLTFKRFRFECSRCEFYLDVGCALSKPNTMMSKIHHHPLAFFNKPIIKLNCNTCGQRCHTPLFRCTWCKLNLHVHCISTLPLAVKSRFHRHPLTLTNSPIKDHPDENDYAEFYCDDCEKERELNQPSYYCRECHYVAHPLCVASEIMCILEEEWTEEESHKCASEVEEPPSPVLKEFLCSLKGDETKEAQDVFEEYRRDSRGYIVDIPRKDQYLGSMAKNRARVTTQIMKMLVSKNEVNNYMILENLAPILEALLGKHGDFIGRSGLSRKVKMLYIMTVCDAVHSMCNTKVVDVTANLLVSWCHSFMLGQHAGFEIEFAFDRLRGVARAHFALQANIIPVDPNFAGHLVEIAKHYALVAGPTSNPKKELTVIEQDGGTNTNELNEKAVSIKLAIIKLAEEIRELEKTAEEKRALHRMWKDCFDDAVELMGEIAGNSLW
ncbi:unnamed protein product [Camellia sinensis]